MTDRPHQPTGPDLDDYNPEFEVRDDAVIGRAFRWSVLILLLIAAPLAAWRFWPGGDETEAKPIEKDPGEIENLVTDTTQMPAITYTDITDAAGLDFIHTNGATGDKLLPETMGGGVAFLDFDNDGDADLLLVNSDHWPDAPPVDDVPTMALYQNDGTGKFTNVTAESGLAVRCYGMGCAVGDYDNDGRVDIFITAVGRNRLFRNTGGSFVEVTDEAGVGGADDQWSSSAGFFDADNDGDLDLFVCNYIAWSRELDYAVNYTINGTDRAYGPPINYTGSHPYFYRNEGGGRFVDASEEAGVRITNPVTGVPAAKSLAVAIVDLNRDGFSDLVVANDTVANFLFLNTGEGSFTETGAHAGIAYDSMGSATGAMGIDAAHYRNDDAIAIGIGNFATEMTSLYVSQRDHMLFSDQSISEGIGSPSRQKLSFGLFFFDCDLDGRLDLLQANGHLEDEINEIQPSQHYRQSAQVFWNQGDDARVCFAAVPDDAAGDLSHAIVGRGAAYADIDGDGDLDVILTQVGDRPLLLRNDTATENNWVRLKLTGAAANRDAIGAIVELDAGGVTYRRQVMPTRSYLSQVELTLTFGLGAAAEIDEVRIHWPGGETQRLTDLPVNKSTTITQPATSDGSS